ncbi:hypothetical protein lerEdw1_017268 [Lerista edwardsae]|nr:hypothetical protein lerEdw1_017268 [Lerista edwardsae]
MLLKASPDSLELLFLWSRRLRVLAYVIPVVALIKLLLLQNTFSSHFLGRWDSKEGEEVPLVKDETDQQISSSTEPLKSRILVGEVVKEQSGPAELEKNAEARDSQEHTGFIPAAQKGGKAPTAGEDQGTKEKTRRCLIQEVSALSTDESEADPKLNKTIFGADLSPKDKDLSPSSCQGMARSTGQAAACALKEISSTLFGDGMDKNAHSERIPNEDCAENLSELLIKTQISDGGQGLVSTVGQGEGDIPKRPKIYVKGSDASARLAHREESRSQTQDKVNISAQEEETMRNKKQEQSERHSKAQQ